MSTDPLTEFCESDEAIDALRRIAADPHDFDRDMLFRLRQAALAYSVSLSGKRFAHLTRRGRTLLERVAH